VVVGLERSLLGSCTMSSSLAASFKSAQRQPAQPTQRVVRRPTSFDMALVAGMLA
jgi:hypothetical protein